MTAPRRFPLTWTVRSNDDEFWVEDAKGVRLAFVYFRDRAVVGSDITSHLARDEAQPAAVNIARLPGLVANELVLQPIPFGERSNRRDQKMEERYGGYNWFLKVWLVLFPLQVVLGVLRSFDLILSSVAAVIR